MVLVIGPTGSGKSSLLRLINGLVPHHTGGILAVGLEAKKMIGRTPSYIVAVRPLRKGAITDFEVTQEMIRLLLKRVGVNRFNRPRVVICVPSATRPAISSICCAVEAVNT